MTRSSNPGTFSVDLTNCDREPIHLLGEIQDFGFVLALSTDWLVRFASTNVVEYLGKSVDDLLGESATDFFVPEAIHAIRGRLQLLPTRDGSERIFSIDLLGNGQCFDLAVHLSNGSIVIDAEPSIDHHETNPGTLVKSMIARVQSVSDLPATFREAVRQLRAATGFDRVMLYRFQDDGAGAVIAESVRSGLETFLGLNYPASDIPTQARALYIRNQIRIIADVDAQPVSIEPTVSPEGEQLDLSLSMLRSVSPIHIEYLKNMGVSASMSVSIVIDGRLWGLFALHHYAPRHLSMEMRSALELFGQMVSLIIEGRLYREQRELEDAARNLHDKFVSKIVASTPSVAALADYADDLREFIACDGFAVYAKQEARTFGQCPFPDDIRGIARFLNRAAASRVYATDELGQVHPPAKEFVDRAAGILAIPISRSPRDYLMFFRKEITQTVSWAGNPNAKETTFGPNGPRLTPRKSFELWKETVHGKSIGWSGSEKKVAESLRISLLEVLLRFNEESERQQNLATQRQELLIAELNHRVRNILSLIRALVAQSRPGAETVDDFAAIIGGRIQALARAHDQITRDDFAAQHLADVIRTEVDAYIGKKADRVFLQGPDISVKANAFSILALVFHELVTNSAKYGALSDSTGQVSVSWKTDSDGFCVIDWVESGGPAVQPPTRRGFGTTIIERSIPHDLGGEANIDYRLSGLKACFSLPPTSFKLEDQPHLEKLGDDRSSAAQALRETGHDETASTLAGLCALIVEDNMIIALDTEQLLLERGMAKVVTAASVTEASKLIAAEKLDVALLDVNLGRETSFPLAATLQEKGVPFVFVTGYGENLDLPAAGVGPAPSIKKPFDADQVVSAILRVIAQRPKD